MNIHIKRREMFKSVGKRLVADLEVVSTGDTDTETQGGAGESAFRDWLNKQLPSRFQAVNGVALSANDPPTTQRDCLIFDMSECPVFRQSGGQPDMFPAEGIIGAFEINTGISGATSAKLLHDCTKLSEVGKLCRNRRALLSNLTKLIPVQIPNAMTIPNELIVAQQPFLLPPILYLFAENIRGNLSDIAARIAIHNKTVPVVASVSGLFVLNKGVVLHITPNQGWIHARLPGFPLAYMEAEPWEVLLKLVSIVWNHLWKGPYTIPDLGSYYADQKYFMDIEWPRCVVLDDPEYISQREEGFVTFQG